MIHFLLKALLVVLFLISNANLSNSFVNHLICLIIFFVTLEILYSMFSGLSIAIGNPINKANLIGSSADAFLI